MRAVISLALKDLLILWRDRIGIFWVIIFPVIMALFFGAMFSSEGSSSHSLKIAAVTDDVSPASERFYEQLEKSDVLVLQHMTLDSARAMVGRGALIAYIQYLASSDNEEPVFSAEQPRIIVGVDPSRKAEASYLRGLIDQAYFALLQQRMTDPSKLHASVESQLSLIDSASGLDGNQRGLLKGFLTSLDKLVSRAGSIHTDSGENYSPFREPDLSFQEVADTRKGPRSSFEISFPQSIQWALIACAAAFALSIVRERTRGTYLRLRLAPISRSQILAGKGLACFVACLTASSILLALGIVAFDVGVTRAAGLVMAMVSAAICFVGIMMLISVLGQTEQAVSGAGWAILLVMSMTGGGMVPLMVLPPWMLTVSNFSPVKWSILAMEGAIWRGFSLSEMMLPLLVLTGIGVAGFTVGVFVLSRSD